MHLINEIICTGLHDNIINIEFAHIIRKIFMRNFLLIVALLKPMTVFHTHIIRNSFWSRK